MRWKSSMSNLNKKGWAIVTYTQFTLVNANTKNEVIHKMYFKDVFL